MRLRILCLPISKIENHGFTVLLSFSHDLAWEFFLIENPKFETAISQSNLHIWLRYFVCEV
jgi:hypothetical protein